MNESEFEERYPNLSDALSCFLDESPHDDKENARRICSTLSPADRAAVLERVITDAHRFLEQIDEEWDTLSAVVHRTFYSRHDAHEWLVFLIRIWRTEQDNVKRSANDKT